MQLHKTLENYHCKVTLIVWDGAIYIYILIVYFKYCMKYFSFKYVILYL